jgi:dihydrofolate reductase
LTNYVYIATSLDGFIAAADGGLGWLDDIPNPTQNDFGYAEFIAKIDAIVMGRKTFQTVLGFGPWPYDVPVFVLSNSLSTIPERLAGKVEIRGGDLRGLVGQLNELGYRNLYIDGGKTIQNFLKDDLIDEMIITTVPVLLGDGIPLFGKLTEQRKFKHLGTDTFNKHLVQSRYTPRSR